MCMPALRSRYHLARRQIPFCASWKLSLPAQSTGCYNDLLVSPSPKAWPNDHPAYQRPAFSGKGTCKKVGLTRFGVLASKPKNPLINVIRAEPTVFSGSAPVGILEKGRGVKLGGVESEPLSHDCTSHPELFGYFAPKIASPRWAVSTFTSLLANSPPQNRSGSSRQVASATDAGGIVSPLESLDLADLVEIRRALRGSPQCGFWSRWVRTRPKKSKKAGLASLNSPTQQIESSSKQSKPRPFHQSI